VIEEISYAATCKVQLETTPPLETLSGQISQLSVCRHANKDSGVQQLKDAIAGEFYLLHYRSVKRHARVCMKNVNCLFTVVVTILNNFKNNIDNQDRTLVASVL
jgi:hypothetical protein